MTAPSDQQAERIPFATRHAVLIDEYAAALLDAMRSGLEFARPYEGDAESSGKRLSWTVCSCNLVPECEVTLWAEKTVLPAAVIGQSAPCEVRLDFDRGELRITAPLPANGPLRTLVDMLFRSETD